MADPTAAAEAIWAAWTGGTTIPELPVAVRPLDTAEGMAAQDALRVLAGDAYGWKIAATSSAGQRHIGVDGPQPGPLFSRFRHEPGDTVPAADLHMRVVEAEFAFRMGVDVEPGADVLDAVAALHLAIELPNSRFDRFEVVGAPQLAADAACAGRFVLGPEVPGWRELDLSTAGTVLWINGVDAAHGSGASVLGDPRTALAWIADELPRHGHRLRAGDVVTTGTTTTPPATGPGDAVRADFGELGSVGITLGR